MIVASHGSISIHISCPLWLRLRGPHCGPWDGVSHRAGSVTGRQKGNWGDRLGSWQRESLEGDRFRDRNLRSDCLQNFGRCRGVISEEGIVKVCISDPFLSLYQEISLFHLQEVIRKLSIKLIHDLLRDVFATSFKKQRLPLKVSKRSLSNLKLTLGSKKTNKTANLSFRGLRRAD